METNNIRRTIHTDTFTPKSQAILEALRQHMINNWGSSQMVRNAELSSLAIEPNGEIVWQVVDSNYVDNRHSYHVYRYERSTFASRRDDQKVREWIACSMKHIVYREFKQCNLPATKNWKRTNNLQLNCFRLADGTKATVAEVYCLFDRLLNRKTFTKRWKKPMLNEIVGKERDTVATELEIARREESKKLDDKFEADKQDLRKKKSEELAKIQEEIYKKYEGLRNELQAAYLQSKKDLDSSLSFMADGNPFA